MFMFFNQIVDQICKFQWDNDEYYVCFMIVFVGFFFEGIGRYCEVVEQCFMKEMDWLIVEELVVQNMMIQEKWMQYVKDVWMMKEKFELFYFYFEVSDWMFFV